MILPSCLFPELNAIFFSFRVVFRDLVIQGLLFENTWTVLTGINISAQKVMYDVTTSVASSKVLSLVSSSHNVQSKQP